MTSTIGLATNTWIIADCFLPLQETYADELEISFVS